MRRLSLFSAIGILSILFLAACQQSSNPVNPQLSDKGPKVTVVDGRIVLNSDKEFLNLINTLKQMSATELVDWDKGIPFTSLQEFYDQHQEGLILGNDNPTFKTQAGDKPFIGDFLATRLINQDGVIQIGSDVYTFQTEGKRLKTEANVFSQTPKNNIEAVSSVSDYKIKVVGNRNLTSANARSAANPDLPLAGTEMKYDEEHAALGFFSQSGVWPFYTSFAIKTKMQQLSGWWIFRSWGSTNAEHLELNNGHLRLTGSEGTTVLDNYNLSAGCDNCSEASAYAGYVTFSFSGNINQVQGTFKSRYNGTSLEKTLY